MKSEITRHRSGRRIEPTLTYAALVKSLKPYALTPRAPESAQRLIRRFGSTPTARI